MGILIYIFVLVTILLSVLCYFFDQFSFNLDTPIENWVNTATYFNGILTPPLLAITSVLIYLTWETSKKELKATNSVLELEKAIKIIAAMLDATNKSLDRSISIKQKNDAFERLLKNSNKNEKMPLYEILKEERIDPKKGKYRFFCILNDFTHMECITKFGKPDFIPQTTLTGKTDNDLVFDLFKHELMNQYFMDLPKSDMARPIIRFIDIMDFIQKYNKKPEIKSTLIDLFLLSIDDMILKLLSECPIIRRHSIFKIIKDH
ncbi:hypothetical protein [Pseudoalteromonas sp. bablab_jr010]|uniref:hypothetical protein n=1 Tax=Pseudoalteromonas sp. bablab_jr010 TaxID=2755063 RepID=UPI0018F321E8|nr:hypothetical protein [Pseudoalteromonas sp. bablab_jr010]